jgi:serine/threonine-protein kinase RsbW
MGNLAADKLTGAVIDRVEAFTGGREQRDDIIVAVLEYQRDPWVHKRITFKHAGSLVSEILEALKIYKLDQGATYGIRLAVDEAMANAWRHGLGRNDEIYFDISYLLSDECFKFRVRDPGSGFDHESLPDPTVPENLFKTSGRGVFLIRQMMDDVDFNELGNEITITKVFPLPSDSEDSDSDRIGFDEMYDLSLQQESLIQARETLDTLSDSSKPSEKDESDEPVKNPSSEDHNQ